MTNLELKKAMKELREDIDSSKDKILIEIFKMAKTLVGVVYDKIESEKTSSEIKEDIQKKTENSFEETYKITSIQVKKIYQRVPTFNPDNLEDLTYTEDGKTYKDRLDQYYIEIFEDKEKNKSFEYALMKYETNLERLLHTETRHIETTVKINKKPKGELWVIIDDTGCDKCIGGTFPEKGTKLPPFHVDCDCLWWYIDSKGLKDKEEIMEDINDEIRRSSI